MLRIMYLSDLHLEYHQDRGAGLIAEIVKYSNLADCLALAGDISRAGILAEPILALCDAFPMVFMVAGNNEYRGAAVDQVDRLLARMDERIPNLRVLRPGQVAMYRERRFLGATMWFPCSPAALALRGGYSDFNNVRGFEPWVWEQNLAWLHAYQTLGKPGDVVITHHLPHHDSIQRDFAGSPMNCYFVCDMEPEIVRLRPAAWIHGHTHHPVSYRVGSTRIVCNPLGYPKEARTSWAPRVIEV